MDKATKIKILRQQLTTWSRAYYVNDKSMVTDAEYDRAYRELQRLEQEEQNVPQTSPTQTVGGLDYTPKKALVHHAEPMLSLEDAFDGDELVDYLDKIEAQVGKQTYIGEQKMDGLSIALTYYQGKLVQAATRGNGIEGEDVTANARMLPDIPHKLKEPLDTEVRGEVFMAKSSFQKINAQRQLEGKKQFANPRNAAAGTLRSNNPELVVKRDLQATFYSLANQDEHEIKTQADVLATLKKWGFPVSSHWEKITNQDELITFIARNQLERNDYDIPIDGLVVKVNDYSVQQQLGDTGVVPRWAVAYKFPPDETETVVEDIKWQLSRTGRLNPVAVLQPVELAGSTISKVSLHNVNYIKELDLRLDDTVKLYKSGDIVPQISEVVMEKRPANSELYSFPTTCPKCGSKLVQPTDEVTLKCVNPGCQVAERILHFVKRDAMDIKGMGKYLVTAMVKAEMVKSPADLYRLSVADFEQLQGVGTKRSEKLVANIQNSKHNSLEKLINGLGIPQVGQRTALKLAQHFQTLEKLQTATIQQLMKTPDTDGDAIAQAVHDYFANEANQKLLHQLISAGVNPKFIPPTPVKQSFWTGNRVVITGKLTSMTRSQATDYLTAHGASVQRAISPSTDYVIAGKNCGQKLAQAQAMAIPVINEHEFHERK